MLLFFFDNMPAKFNRVLGAEVDLDIAIQCLNHMVELHMTEGVFFSHLILISNIHFYLFVATFTCREREEYPRNTPNDSMN